MNLDNFDLEALNRDLQEYARQQRERSWFRRNWPWFAPTLTLVLMIIGGFALYWSFYLRIYSHELCRSSMQTIAADKGLQESLGQPIQTVKWPSQATTPSARIEETEADIHWLIEGPKGSAKVHAQARFRAGKWETHIFDVTFPDGEKVSLLKDDGEGAAPPFVPAQPEDAAPREKKPENEGPPPIVDIPVIPE